MNLTRLSVRNTAVYTMIITMNNAKILNYLKLENKLPYDEAHYI